MMKNILVLSFFPAFAPPATGGEARLYYFYKGLSRFYKITLLSSSHPGDKEDVFYHGNAFVERRIAKDHFFIDEWQKLEKFSSGGDLSAICTVACGQFLTKLHEAYLEEYEKAQIIIHDFPFMVDYDLFFQSDDKIRIYNAHNCETQLYRNLHSENKSKPLWEMVENAERKILKGCDAVMYCNETDLAEFKKIGLKEGCRAIHVPNGAVVRQEQRKRKKSIALKNAVFMGSAHPPNTEAAIYIANKIASNHPHIDFHIIGDCLPAGKYPKNLIRHGFVEEKKRQEILLNADLAINPVMSGSGSSLKVFEFLSFSIPLLTTEFGARGVELEHGKNAIISNRNDFNLEITKFHENFSSLLAIAESGCNLLMEKYSWDVISDFAARAIEKIKRKNIFSHDFFLVLNDYDSFSNVGGGGVRTKALYRAAKELRPVIFISFSANNKISVRSEDGILIFNIPKEQDHVNKENEINAKFYISVNDILASRFCCENKVLTSIYNILKKNSAIIIVEHVYMSALPIFYNDRFIYSSHNNEFEIKKESLRYHPLRDALLDSVARLEMQAVARSAAVIAVSYYDADSFMQRTHAAAPVLVIENGAAKPLPSAINSDVEKIEKDRAAVFVGSAHAPNVEAVQYIIENLAPIFSDCQFHIIGSVGESFLNHALKNVYLWGTLSEEMKSAVMQACSVALNPVLSGGGSNIKIADYFANGLYVVSTKFGLRGYDKLFAEGVYGVEIEDFPAALKRAFNNPDIKSKAEEERRKSIFRNFCSMEMKAGLFVDFLRTMMQPKKRVLFVGYRYTSPEQGGAEIHISRLLQAMDSTDRFQVDVIVPCVSEIKNHDRFAETYSFDRKRGAKVGFRNTRFMRFSVDHCKQEWPRLLQVWRAQPLFEKNLYMKVCHAVHQSALAWGWSALHDGERCFRWAFSCCGLHLQDGGVVELECYAPESIAFEIRDEKGYLLADGKMKGDFKIEFIAQAGFVEIMASVPESEVDPRPLAFMLFNIKISAEPIDLSATVFSVLSSIPYTMLFDCLDAARMSSRDVFGVRLTDIRGPFSADMENYIEQHVADYDLLVTHNNVFRPAVFAVDAAKAAGVPVISVPHVHLDDDYYHFSDVYESIVRSDRALLAPRAAVDFYAKKGANAIYHAPGVDIKGGNEAEDIAAFRHVFSLEKPFFLVLGRKSATKGYQLVWRAVERLSERRDVHLVLIGIDEDGVELNASCVSFLGAQSDQIVRGALLECLALVNMSSSESFGIVLLEAWAAGKPVIVNKNCAAFHDLAVDGENAIMAHDVSSLEQAMETLLQEPECARRLALNGQRLLADYSWQRSEEMFVECVDQLLAERGVGG